MTNELTAWFIIFHLACTFSVRAVNRPVVYFEFSLRHLYYKWVGVAAKIQIRRVSTHFEGRRVDPGSEASF